MAIPACGSSQQGWGRATGAGRDAKCSPVCPLGLSVGLKDGPVLCQWPQSAMDVQPGKMVSATLGEIHFPRCCGREMGPASHPSAQWESGKPESSLAENSPASPAQQSQNRQGGRRQPRTPSPGCSGWTGLGGGVHWHVGPSEQLLAPSGTKC